MAKHVGPSKKYRYRRLKEEDVGLHERYFYSKEMREWNSYALEEVMKMFHEATAQTEWDGNTPSRGEITRLFYCAAQAKELDEES